MLSSKNQLTVKTIQFSDTIPEEVYHILPQLREIYDITFEMTDEVDWINICIKRGENTRLCLFYQDQNLVGFSSSGIQQYYVQGKSYAIYHAGVYTVPGVHLGPRITLNGLIQAIEYKVKNPTQNLAYITNAASPASYCLLLDTAIRCYPHPNHDMPAYVNELLNAFIDENALVLKDQHDLIIKYPYTRKILDNTKIRTSPKFLQNKHYHDYIQRNPNYSDGEGMLLYFPLGFSDIALNAIACGKKMIYRQQP